VERRLAVLAGPDVQVVIVRRTRRAWIAVLAAISLAGTVGPADARPKRRDARLAFDRGVSAYQKGDFVGASEALGRSYQLEHDVETLFAWAQAERRLERCDKAIELYGKLLEFKLPAANKTAVGQKLEECRAIVAAQAPKSVPKPEPPPVQPPPVQPPPAQPPPVQSPPAPAEPVAPSPPVVSQSPAPAAPVLPKPPAPRAWYREPVTLTLLGVGVATTAVGGGLLISARSEHIAALNAKSLEEIGPHSDRARSRLRIGFFAGGAGIAVLGGGVAWMLLHHDSGERRTVTGWLAPDGGGLAITGPF
jgi:tetratricopeptide (TPR) repeat protein